MKHYRDNLTVGDATVVRFSLSALRRLRLSHAYSQKRLGT
jgi:hypothetical protein